MVAQERWAGASGTVCPAPMTRAALLALRAAGTLQKDCAYVITDHVQGRLVAGTQILLRALDGSTLSENVSVKTTYDNVAWAGIYDIDTALVTELRDNRGNVARGLTGSEVSGFDWGNAAYSNCFIENATWTVTYGSTTQMSDVKVTHRGNLTTTTMLGSFSDVEVSNNAIANFAGATVNWSFMKVTNGGSFNAAGYTGGGSSTYSTLSGVNANLSANTGAVTFTNSQIYNSTLTLAGTSTVSITGTIARSLLLNRPAGGGPVSLNQFTVESNATITASGSGSLSMTGGRMNGVVDHTGTGNMVANYCEVSEGGTIRNAGSGAVSLTRVRTYGSGSLVGTDAGSSKPMTLSGVDVSDASAVRVVGAAASGPALVVGNTTLRSGSYIYARHTGALTVNYGTLTSHSSVDAQSGDRSYTFDDPVLHGIGRVSLTGTGAFTDTSAGLRCTNQGLYTNSCRGAANSLNYSTISGPNGVFTYSGTTGGQASSRLKLQDGAVTITNTATNVGLTLSSVRDLGRITVTGVVTAKAIQYVDVASRATMTVNESTGGGTLTDITLMSGGAYTVSGAAAGAAGVVVMRGTLAHNGGNLSGVHKAGNAVLTTGNFNHTNIASFTNTNFAMTAANTDAQRLYPGALV